MKKIVLLLFLLSLLSACSGFEKDEIIVLKDTIYVGESVDELNEANEEAKMTGVFVSGGAIKSFYEGDTIQVIGEDEASQVVLIKIIGGLYDGTEWWALSQELRQVSGR